MLWDLVNRHPQKFPFDPTNSSFKRYYDLKKLAQDLEKRRTFSSKIHEIDSLLERLRYQNEILFRCTVGLPSVKYIPAEAASAEHAKKLAAEFSLHVNTVRDNISVAHTALSTMVQRCTESSHESHKVFLKLADRRESAELKERNDGEQTFNLLVTDEKHDDFWREIRVDVRPFRETIMPSQRNDLCNFLEDRSDHNLDFFIYGESDRVLTTTSGTMKRKTVPVEPSVTNFGESLAQYRARSSKVMPAVLQWIVIDII